MIFTSLNFFIFFPAVCLLFCLTPKSVRWLLLLVASYFYYLNLKPVFALIMGSITISTYIFTRLIDRSSADEKKKFYMRLNIVLILLPLLFFKYFIAINNMAFQWMDQLGVRYPFPEIPFLLPIGISFYTFMAIGYTVDVYNEELAAEKNIGIVALFISFFPLVLSGPIERAGNMLPQLRNIPNINPGNITKGLKWMLWGYFMKLVVADRLGIYIDTVYAHPQQYNGTTFVLTTILYPFQVYGDLGGYSLIAIGAAKVMGFNVIQNFRRPFFSVSMSEFWRRWHISLITWITDYIYTPLAFHFRKHGRRGIVLALMFAFLISGIWHGAALTFVAWGIMQGTFLSIEAVTARRRMNFRTQNQLSHKWWFIALCCLLTFVLFASSQVFARSRSIGEAMSIFAKMVSDIGLPYLDLNTLAVGVAMLGILLLSDFRDEFFPGRFKVFNNRYIVVRFGSYLAIFLLIILFGVVSGQFIYFKF